MLYESTNMHLCLEAGEAVASGHASDGFLMCD